jgi:hypothetical protein
MEVNQDGLKLNGTFQLFVYADDGDVLVGDRRAVKQNKDALVVASKGIILQVNADKTRCMVLPQERRAGRNLNVEIDVNSFERIEKFKYLGTTVTSQNSIPEEIQSRVKSGNACCHSVQIFFLSSMLLSQNLKIKIYRTLILPVVLCRCENWSLTLREERRLNLFRIGCCGEYMGLRGTR